MLSYCIYAVVVRFWPFHFPHQHAVVYRRKTGSSQPCLDVRKKLSACYQQNPGQASSCDVYVNELGTCIELGVERINKEGK